MVDWKNPGSSNIAGQQSVNKFSRAFRGNVLFGAIDLPMNMAQGDDFGTAAMKAGTTAALWTVAPAIMSVHLAATALPAVAGSVHQWQRGKAASWNAGFAKGQVGGQYQDTQRALTMRQAGIEAIQGSKLNARSALGGEARILSQNWTR